MPVRKSKDKEEDVKGHSLRDSDKSVRSVRDKRNYARGSDDDVKGHSLREPDKFVRDADKFVR